MKTRNKGVLIVVAACLAAFLACGTAVAAVRTISGVTIRVGLNVQPGDTLPNIDIVYDTTDAQDNGAYAATNSTKYSIRDTEWITNEDRYVAIGDQPKMRIYLETSDLNYAFRGSYSSSNVTIKGGTFISARREADGELAVVVALNGVKGQYDAPVSAEWRDSGYGRAIWNVDWDSRDEYIEATTTGYYDVYLYRGNTVVHKLEEYRGTSYNFYPYMTRKGTYHYKVRTVPHTEVEKQYGKKSEWLESDEIYIDEENVSDGSGRVDANGVLESTAQVGWIQSDGTWYFRYPNGTYQTNGWLKLNNIWYLFDASGKMLTGWQQVKGLWYFMQTDGAMVTGWIKAGDYWYYLNTLADGGVEGAMHTGWLNVGGKVYYLNSDGTMAEGWREIDGKFYYFYPGYGYMATNTWIGTYFYVDANGVWVPNPQ